MVWCGCMFASCFRLASPGLQVGFVLAVRLACSKRRAARMLQQIAELSCDAQSLLCVVVVKMGLGF